MKLNWTDPARHQLEAIIARYDRLSAGAGRRAARQITAATRRLRQYPLSGRIVPEFDSPYARELVVGEFRVLYEPSPDRIEIFAVLSARMDLRPPAN